MRVLISGATGLVGAALTRRLEEEGHSVVALVRREPQQDKEEIGWDPRAGVIDANDLEGLEAVVHLSGENIAGRRWSAAQKEEIRASRVDSTRLLCETLAQLKRPPAVLLCASAIGYYGDRQDEILREDSGAGVGFLAQTSMAWEEATQAATKRGIRVVNLRFGILLSKYGGALAKMLLPFKMGVGGKIGSGRQYMSWISLDDTVEAMRHTLAVDQMEGPVNIVTQNPVTNAEFTKILGRVLRRPTLFPLPIFAARLALGEMADALLLASTRVEPARLLEAGFEFRHADLETALRYLLDK
jgi:uncharacterized protein (TIGR01777 family)